MTPALDPQLGLLGSPPDPVGRFPMWEGPSREIVRSSRALRGLELPDQADKKSVIFVVDVILTVIRVDDPSHGSAAAMW